MPEDAEDVVPKPEIDDSEPEGTNGASGADEPVFADSDDYATRKYRAYMAERKDLVDAARESARTFDKAVLTFGAAVFGASVAFLKDVASNPQSFSLKWLALSWFFFSAGLLFVLLSFLCSHSACMFDIAEAGTEYDTEGYKRKRNPWSNRTDLFNILCIVALFIGLLLWSVFAIENLLWHKEENHEQPQGRSVSAAVTSEEGIRTAPATPQPSTSTTTTATSSTKEVEHP